MSDISGQLIKNSYNYVLQSDIISGIVHRIGGDVPTNPKFISGLTVNTVFTYSNGTEVDGYVLTCDASGNASWEPVSGTTPSSGVTSVTVTNGLSGNVTTGAITLVNTAPDQIVIISGGTGITTGGTYPNFIITNSSPDQTVTISGGTDIQIVGTYPSFEVNFTGTTSSNFTGGTVSGSTNFTNGLTANTISATTYQNLPALNCNDLNNCPVITGLTGDVITLISNVATIQGDITTIQGDITTIQGDITGTSNEILYFDASGNITSDVNFTRLDLNSSSNTSIITNNINDVNLTQDTVFEFDRVRSRVNDNTNTLYGQTNLTSTGYFNIINNTTNNTFSGLDIVENGGSFKYTDANGNYNGFFYTDQQPGWSVEKNGNQYDYFLPKSAFAANTVLTDVNGDGNLTWTEFPTDIFTTGGTYTNGDIVFTYNDGNTYSVTGLPTGSNGGGGLPYYLNLSVNQTPYKEFSPIPTTAAEQTGTTSIASTVTSTIGSFLTPVGFPNTNLFPGGVFTFHLHCSKENSNASFNVFVEVYKRTSGGTETLLFTTDPVDVTTNTPTPSMQISDAYFSGCPLVVSDRILVKVRATNTSNQTHSITLYTEGSQHYSYATTTFSNVGLTCDTLSGCTTIVNIQSSLNNKYDKSGGTVKGFVRVQPTPATNQKALFSISENSSESIALYGLAGKGTNAYGVYCDVSPSIEFTTITNGIGGYFEVGGQFSYGEPTNKYSLQLKDGTQGVGKVLTSVTSDGKANWSNTLNVSAVTATTITSNSVKVLPVALTVVSNTASTDASLSSIFTLTLTGNTTLATPTNGFSGQRIVYRLRQDGTGNKLLTLSSGFRSGPITVTLSTAANTTDYLGVIYNEIDNEWDVLALNKGYS